MQHTPDDADRERDGTGGAFDLLDDGKPVVAFGEILLRLSPPGKQLLLQTPRLDVWVGGAEANVATALARLGHATRLISALPEGPLGDAGLAAVRANGVDTGSIRRGPGRMGLYWVETGAGLRPTEVLYDRAGSAFAAVPAQEWNFEESLAGAGLLHLSGITPALGPNGAAAALAAARAATGRGIPVAFDGNHRSRLWDSWNSDPRTVLAGLVGEADILFGNHRDIALLLDRDFPAGSKSGRADRDRAAAEAAFSAFPRLRIIASTARVVLAPDRHRLTARVDTPDTSVETEELVIDGIVDRIGTGDAFAAGFLHGLLSRQSHAAAASTGLALSALKHSVPGDMSPFDTRTLAAFTADADDVRR